MTPIIESLGQKFAHFGGFEGSFLTILRVKNSLSGHFPIFFNFWVNNLVSLLPITGALLWGSREALINVDEASPGLLVHRFCF